MTTRSRVHVALVGGGPGDACRLTVIAVDALRRWLEVADSSGMGLELIGVLEHTAILVRGPKAGGAIRAAGLDDAGMSDEQTTPSRVGVVLLDREADDERVARLIDAVCSRQLDCVTFTSAPAVDALLAAANADGHLERLLSAFSHDVLTAGVEPIRPEQVRMGTLIRLVREHLAEDGVDRVETRHGLVELRGSIAFVGGRTVRLAPSSLALFRRLVRARGAVVSRAELTAAMPSGSDEHAMEVALSRLRRSLGDAGVVATVVKRGYRLDI